MLTVEIPAQQDGPLEQRLTPTPEDVGLDPTMFRDVEVEVRLEQQRRQAIVSIQARATATLECDRSLKLYDQPLVGKYHLLVVPPDDPQAVESDEAVLVLSDDSHRLDITEPVRDTLLLAVPMRRVSPEAEKIPVRTSFGELVDEDGDSIDPRWEALRRLRAEDDTEEST